MTDEQKKLTRLYDLRNRAIRERKKDDEATLNWAIHLIEMAMNIKA